jgi:hypothetical protein
MNATPDGSPADTAEAGVVTDAFWGKVWPSPRKVNATVYRR